MGLAKEPGWIEGEADINDPAVYSGFTLFDMSPRSLALPPLYRKEFFGRASRLV